MSRQPLAVVVEREPRTDGQGYFQLLLDGEVADELRDDRRDIRLTTTGGGAVGFARPITIEATRPDGFALAALRLLDKDETLR